MMKRLLIVLVTVVMLYMVACFVRYYTLPPEVQAQTNTFCAANLACTVSAAWTFSSNLTVSGTGTLNGASQTLTNPNSTVVCDGTKYATIQAAAAALPVTGGEVIVPSASTCTWNGAGMTGSVTIRFNSAAASYSPSAQVAMTNGANHLICAAGQALGLSGQNNATFPNAGTILNFTGSLTASQDAITISGNNNNDGNSVEGCYFKGGGGGRYGVHISGSSGNRILFNVFDDFGAGATTGGVWVDGGSTSGSHSYENRIQGNDVIHSGGDGYLVSVDPAGTGIGGDVDGTIIDHDDYHPRDVGSGSSSGQGCHLLVPSTAATNQIINATVFTKFLSNGSANATYACKLEVLVAAPAQSYITNTKFLAGELEDVYQANTGTSLLVSSPNVLGIQNLAYEGSLGSGFTASHNVNLSSQNVGNFILRNGNAVMTNATSAFSAHQQDALFFPNTFATANGWCMPGPGIQTNNGNYRHSIGSDGIEHVYRFDGATTCTSGGNFLELYKIDHANHHWTFTNFDLTIGAGSAVTSTGAGGTMASVLTATSAAFATATTAGTCVQNTTAVANATTAMAVSVSPVSTPGIGAVWSAFVSSTGNVTINECAVATSAGGTIAFNIRVTP